MQTGSRRRACWLLIALATTGILRAQDKALAPSPIVDANTRFAFSLFQQLTTQTPDHNILVAPTGLSLTFSLLDNGSDPETRKEIESAFEFAGMDIVGINAGFAALRKEMNLIPLPPQKKAAHADAPAPWIDNPNRLVIADSLWIKHGYFGKEFLDMSRDYYGVDLKKWLPSPSASAQIGLWASSEFKSRCRSISARWPKTAFSWSMLRVSILSGCTSSMRSSPSRPRSPCSADRRKRYP